MKPRSRRRENPVYESLSELDNNRIEGTHVAIVFVKDTVECSDIMTNYVCSRLVNPALCPSL